MRVIIATASDFPLRQMLPAQWPFAGMTGEWQIDEIVPLLNAFKARAEQVLAEA